MSADFALTELATVQPHVSPALDLHGAAEGSHAATRFLQFPYSQSQHAPLLPRGGPAVLRLLAEHGIVDLTRVEPIHVAEFVEVQLTQNSKPTVKQRLAALLILFDWMVVGQVLPVNPAHAVRGPKHSQRRGKRPVQ